MFSSSAFKELVSRWSFCILMINTLSMYTGACVLTEITTDLVNDLFFKTMKLFNFYFDKIIMGGGSSV